MNRYRITFSKTEAMRFTSHLDLHRALERTMRRADLPLAYSEGFTPRPKLSLASALPLGYTSEAEVADFWLMENMPHDQIEHRFTTFQPPGIVLHRVEPVAENAPKLQTSLIKATYLVTLREPHPDLENRLAQLLNAETIPKEMIKKGKKKTLDIRPLISELKLAANDEEGNRRLQMTLQAEPSATGRPDHILEELGIDPLNTQIQRTGLIFG